MLFGLCNNSGREKCSHFMFVFYVLLVSVGHRLYMHVIDYIKGKNWWGISSYHLVLICDADKQTQETVQTPAHLSRYPPLAFVLSCCKTLWTEPVKTLIDSWWAGLKIAAILIIQSHHLFKLISGHTNKKGCNGNNLSRVKYRSKKYWN